MKNYLIILLLLFFSNLIFSQTTPNITQQPTNQIVTFGNTAVFTVSATSDGEIGYQWWKVPFVSESESKVIDIPGKIEGTLTNQLKILNVNTDDNNTQYLCEVNNLSGYPADGYWVNSNTVTLTVNSSTEKFVKIVYPTDELGYEFEAGSKVTIKWISNLVDKVNLEYTANAGKTWNLIAQNLDAALSSYEWTIPNTPSIFCSIKITSTANANIFDINPKGLGLDTPEPSNYFFTIFDKSKWKIVPNLTNSSLQDIKFINQQDGFIYSKNELIITNDAGKNWYIKNSFSGYGFDAVSFVSQNTGWGIKDNFLYKTIDGGKNWESIFNDMKNDNQNDYNYNNLKLQMYDDTLGWYCYFGSIYRTIDGGISWLNIGGWYEKVIDFKFLNKKVGWFIGYGIKSLVVITDMGKFYSFASDSLLYLKHFYGWYTKMDLLNYNNYWLLNYFDEYMNPVGGQMPMKIEAVNEQNSGEVQYSAMMKFDKTNFISKNIGWLIGNTWYTHSIALDSYVYTKKSNFICMSTDGGENWELQSLGFSGKINSLYSYDSESAWAVGDSGLIMHYGDFKVTHLTITQQPTNQSVTLGNNATFSVSATSDGELGYQWWKVPFVSESESKIVDIPGKIEGTLTNQLKILNVNTDDNNTQYLCEVKNLSGYPADGYWVNSNTVTLTVNSSTEKFVKIVYPTDELGYEFEAGSKVTIKWISNLVDKVNLEYTANAGKTWNLITENLDAALSGYEWTIPNTPSIFCSIKITSTANTNIFDINPKGSPINLTEPRSYFFTIYDKNKWSMEPNITSSNLQDIKFINQQDGFIYNKNELITTNDAGKNWSVKNSFSDYGFDAVSFVSQNTGWGIKDNFLYKTIDGGKNWENIFNDIKNGILWGDYNNLRLQMYDDTLGWYCHGGSIFRTIDAGNSWLAIGGFIEPIFDFKFINKNIGWFGGRSALNVEERSIFITDNGRFNSNLDSIYSMKNESGYLTKIDLLDYNNYWLVNDFGLIDHSDWTPMIIELANVKTPRKIQYAALMEFKQIKFFTNQHGWLVGNTLINRENSNVSDPKSNYICVSEDGGENWELQFLGLTKNINSIYSYDGETAWAVGDSGLIMHYGDFKDSRLTITQQPTNQSVTLGNNAAFSVSASADGELGYQWWKVPYVSDSESKIVDIPGRFEITYARHDDVTECQLHVLNTTNEDNNTQYLCEVKNLSGYPADGYWVNSNTVTLTVNPSTEKFAKIVYPTNELGYEFEAGSKVKIKWISNLVDKVNLEYTTNAGKTWNLITENLDASLSIYEWTVPNTPSIFCAIKITSSADTNIYDINPKGTGDPFNYYFTIYGKSKWTKEPNLTNSSLQVIKFINQQDGFIYSKNELIATNDAGKNWYIKNSFSDYGFGAVSFVSQNTGWGIKDNFLYKTNNGGKNWSLLIDTLYYNSIYSTQAKIQMLDDTLGWYSFGQGIFRTLDGGNSWTIIGSHYYLIINFEFINKNLGWFTGLTSSGGRATAYITNNGKFYIFPDNTGEELKNVSGWGGLQYNFELLDYNNFWQIKPSLDGDDEGMRIIPWNIETTNELDSNKILYSAIMNFKKIKFISTKQGWLFGNTIKNAIADPDYVIPTAKSNFICMSIDGGENWELQTLGFTKNINSIYSYDGETAWAVGDSGLIMHYGDFNVSDVTNENQNIPTEYNLSQNYPNPFNPTTTIRYSVPSPSVILSKAKNLKDFSTQAFQNDNMNVTLKVYDVLGRRVTTLVNEEQKPGFYEVSFNASNLSSGIYYYQIKVGNFVQTKKMILMK